MKNLNQRVAGFLLIAAGVLDTIVCIAIWPLAWPFLALLAVLFVVFGGSLLIRVEQ